MNNNNNESSSGTITNKENLEAIISTFPDGIEYSFGYGSGVFVQEENNVNSNQNAMVDLILSVSDARLWHERNIGIYPHHYSTLPKIMGPRFIVEVQQLGAGCYFNPMAQVNVKNVSDNDYLGDSNISTSSSGTCSKLVKYGVISHDNLKQDLMEWNHLYVAGRMHKPILNLDVKEGISDEIHELQENYNLRYALSAALLILPLQRNFDETEKEERIQLSDLFESIAGLSYIGDPRQTAGAEDPQKITKLVNSSGAFERWKEMYRSHIDKLVEQGILNAATENMHFQSIDINLNDRAVQKALFENLPMNIQNHKQFNLQHYKDAESSKLSLYEPKSFAYDISKILTTIVGPPARIQSAKGVVTAGIYKSALYLAAKLKKGALRDL